MGYGYYSTAAYDRIRTTKGYGHMTRAQIFAARSIDPDMDPRTIVTRESRDSDEHPTACPSSWPSTSPGAWGSCPNRSSRTVCRR